MSKRTALHQRDRAPSPAATSAAAAWASARVSRRSAFGDDVWHLDIETAARRADQKRLSWNVAVGDGSRLTDPQHASLLNAAKQFLWSMATDPPRGRKRLSPSSLHTRAQPLIAILKWMIDEGHTSFAGLDAAAVDRLRAWLKARRVPHTGRPIAPAAIVSYLLILKDLYRQRAKLDDAPQQDPLPLETTFEAAGITPASTGWIAFIPELIAINLLSKALDFINSSVGKMEAAIAADGLAKKTTLILSAKHGQSPMDPAALLRVPDGAIIDGLAFARAGALRAGQCPTR